MKNDHVGRWIEADELEEFSKLKWNERIRWVREELNKLYVGHYSVKKVAVNSRVISHSGLYNLEGSTSPLPRQSTMESLAAYYQVPETIFTATHPQRFFLGRRYEENDIRLAQYEVEIRYTLRSPVANENPQEKIFLLKTRHMDAEELLQRLENEVDLTLKRLEKQSRLDKAYDTLRNAESAE